jgi:hypothetical protein
LKKYIDNLQLLIFTASLNSYNVLTEDEDQLFIIKEEIKLFEEVLNSQYFTNTPIFLLFTYNDLFKNKIKDVDLNVCFGNYQGGKDYDNAIKYIEKKFKKKYKKNDIDKKIKTFAVNLTDINDVFNVFNEIEKYVNKDTKDKNIN